MPSEGDAGLPLADGHSPREVAVVGIQTRSPSSIPRSLSELRLSHCTIAGAGRIFRPISLARSKRNPGGAYRHPCSFLRRVTSTRGLDMLRNLRDRRLVLVILNCALMLLCGGGRGGRCRSTRTAHTTGAPRIALGQFVLGLESPQEPQALDLRQLPQGREPISEEGLVSSDAGPRRAPAIAAPAPAPAQRANPEECV